VRIAGVSVVRTVFTGNRRYEYFDSAEQFKKFKDDSWTALKLADYVVTEAGFGADLGAEKFFDIKCRKAGLTPECAVVVATIRALKMHGGVGKNDLKTENVFALELGFSNLARHVSNLRKYGVPVIVAVNRFSSDTDAERGPRGSRRHDATSKRGVSARGRPAAEAGAPAPG